jgi:hypothetical protein
MEIQGRKTSAISHLTYEEEHAGRCSALPNKFTFFAHEVQKR